MAFFNNFIQSYCLNPDTWKQLFGDEVSKSLFFVYKSTQEQHISLQFFTHPPLF